MSVNGRTVWRADSGIWRAEVDPSRGRLAYLGPRNGPNFLNAPAVPSDRLQLGGHRVWLGPQTEWKPFWPPPENWEMAPALTVKLRRPDLLEVESPAGTGDAVAIRRTYRWSANGRLECGVSWEERTRRGRQAMQIFQLAGDVVFEAIPKPTGSVPRGFVRLPIGSRPATETIFPLPRQATRSGDRILLRRKSAEEKLGFPTQTLSARWPQGALLLRAGRIKGKTVEEPDRGFNAQIYLGGDDVPLLEFEQLSPRLIPWRPGDRVGSTVLLELRSR